MTKLPDCCFDNSLPDNYLYPCKFIILQVWIYRVNSGLEGKNSVYEMAREGKARIQGRRAAKKYNPPGWKFTILKRNANPEKITQ